MKTTCFVSGSAKKCSWIYFDNKTSTLEYSHNCWQELFPKHFCTCFVLGIVYFKPDKKNLCVVFTLESNNVHGYDKKTERAT